MVRAVAVCKAILAFDPSARLTVVGSQRTGEIVASEGLKCSFEPQIPIMPVMKAGRIKESGSLWRIARWVQPDTTVGFEDFFVPWVSYFQGCSSVVETKYFELPDWKSTRALQHSLQIASRTVVPYLVYPRFAPAIPQRLAERCTLVPPILREDFYAESQEAFKDKLGIDANEKAVLFLADWFETERLLKAMILSGIHLARTWNIAVIILMDDHFPAKTASAAERMKNVIVRRGYVKDFHLYLKAADLVVMKPGFNTLSECAAVGRPCLLLPTVESLEAQKNIETANQIGLGVVAQGYAEPHELSRWVVRCLNDFRLRASAERICVNFDRSGAAMAARAILEAGAAPPGGAA